MNPFRAFPKNASQKNASRSAPPVRSAFDAPANETSLDPVIERRERRLRYEIGRAHV